MWKIVLATKSHHGGGAFHAQPRLERAGLIVDPRVDDTAVVSALVAGNTVFFFRHQQAEAGEAADEMHRGREADNASADHQDVTTLVGHESRTGSAATPGSRLTDKIGSTALPVRPEGGRVPPRVQVTTEHSFVRRKRAGCE